MLLGLLAAVASEVLLDTQLPTIASWQRAIWSPTSTAWRHWSRRADE